MKKLIQTLTWLPLLGIVFEFAHIARWSESHQTDPNHGSRLIIATTWHILGVGIFCLALVLTLNS